MQQQSAACANSPRGKSIQLGEVRVAEGTTAWPSSTALWEDVVVLFTFLPSLID